MFPLAHDQVWSRDDWLTIALVPPVLFFGTIILMGTITAFTDRARWSELMLFSVKFLGSVVMGAWLMIWAIVGIVWAGGWL